MKYLFSFIVLIFSIQTAFSQETEKVDIPNGVVYKYCDPGVYQNTLNKLDVELGETPDYSTISSILFIGPILWKRYSKVDSLAAIEAGNVTLIVDGYKKKGKMTQDENDARMVWNHLRNEIKGEEYTLRKATHDELLYYWSIISFDIEEPLIVLETGSRRYILDYTKDLNLVWIEELP